MLAKGYQKQSLYIYSTELQRCSVQDFVVSGSRPSRCAVQFTAKAFPDQGGQGQG